MGCASSLPLEGVEPDFLLEDVHPTQTRAAIAVRRLWTTLKHQSALRAEVKDALRKGKCTSIPPPFRCWLYQHLSGGVELQRAAELLAAQHFDSSAGHGSGSGASHANSGGTAPRPFNLYAALLSLGPATADVDRTIRNDVHRTLPQYSFFGPRSRPAPGQCQLYRILTAYAHLDGTVGYTQGMNFLAALLLLAGLPEEPAFYCLAGLMLRHGLRCLYGPGLPGCLALQSAVETELWRRHPAFAEALFNRYGLIPAMFVPTWALSMFISSPLPPSSALVVLDSLMLGRPPAQMAPVGDSAATIGLAHYYSVAAGLTGSVTDGGSSGPGFGLGHGPGHGHAAGPYVRLLKHSPWLRQVHGVLERLPQLHETPVHRDTAHPKPDMPSIPLASWTADGVPRALLSACLTLATANMHIVLGIGQDSSSGGLQSNGQAAGGSSMSAAGSSSSNTGTGKLALRMPSRQLSPPLTTDDVYSLVKNGHGPSLPLARLVSVSTANAPDALTTAGAVSDGANGLASAAGPVAIIPALQRSDTRQEFERSAREYLSAVSSWDLEQAAGLHSGGGLVHVSRASEATHGVPVGTVTRAADGTVTTASAAVGASHIAGGHEHTKDTDRKVVGSHGAAGHAHSGAHGLVHTHGPHHHPQGHGHGQHAHNHGSTAKPANAAPGTGAKWAALASQASRPPSAPLVIHRPVGVIQHGRSEVSDDGQGHGHGSGSHSHGAGAGAGHGHHSHAAGAGAAAHGHGHQGDGQVKGHAHRARARSRSGSGSHAQLQADAGAGTFSVSHVPQPGQTGVTGQTAHDGTAGPGPGPQQRLTRSSTHEPHKLYRAPSDDRPPLRPRAQSRDSAGSGQGRDEGRRRSGSTVLGPLARRGSSDRRAPRQSLVSASGIRPVPWEKPKTTDEDEDGKDGSDQHGLGLRARPNSADGLPAVPAAGDIVIHRTRSGSDLGAAGSKAGAGIAGNGSRQRAGSDPGADTRHTWLTRTQSSPALATSAAGAAAVTAAAGIAAGAVSRRNSGRSISSRPSSAGSVGMQAGPHSVQPTQSAPVAKRAAQQPQQPPPQQQPQPAAQPLQHRPSRRWSRDVDHLPEHALEGALPEYPLAPEDGLKGFGAADFGCLQSIKPQQTGGRALLPIGHQPGPAPASGPGWKGSARVAPMPLPDLTHAPAGQHGANSAGAGGIPYASSADLTDGTRAHIFSPRPQWTFACGWEGQDRKIAVPWVIDPSGDGKTDGDDGGAGSGGASTPRAATGHLVSHTTTVIHAAVTVCDGRVCPGWAVPSAFSGALLHTIAEGKLQEYRRKQKTNEKGRNVPHPEARVHEKHSEEPWGQ